MPFRSSVVPAFFVLLAFVGSSCDGGSTTAPSPTPTPIRTPTPTPTPTPTYPRDYSQIVGTWNLDLRFAEVTVEGNIYGDKGCVPDTMRSQIGASSTYTLTITDSGTATLKNPSTNYSSTFPIWAEGGDFGDPPVGYFTSDILVVRCSDGPEHRLFPYAGGLSGHLSGEELSGTWGVALMDLDDVSPSVQLTARFTGKR